MTEINCDNLEDDCWKYKLMDLDTNEEILYAIYANDETGEYEVSNFTDESWDQVEKNNTPLTIKRKGNIKLFRIVE